MARRDGIYLINCTDPYHQDGLIASIQGLMSGTGRVIPDTSFFLHGSSFNGYVETRDIAKKLSRIYKEWAEIFTNPKLILHQPVLEEMTGRKQSHIHYANHLPTNDPVFNHYNQALENLRLPPATPFPDQTTRDIYHELVSIFTRLDDTLSIQREGKARERGHKTRERLSPVDIQNLSYTLTWAITDPVDGGHLLLARDLDYRNLFNAFMWMITAEGFDRRNGRATLAKLGTPDIKITLCDQRSSFQPFYVGASTQMWLGQKHNRTLPGLADIVRHQPDSFRREMRKRIQSIVRGLNPPAEIQKPRELKITGGLSDVYELVVAELPTLSALEVRQKLGLYHSIYKAAREKGDSVAARIKGDVRHYLETVQHRYSIGGNNLQTHITEGTLGEALSALRELQETSALFDLPQLAMKAKGQVDFASRNLKKEVSGLKSKEAVQAKQLQDALTGLNETRRKIKGLEALVDILHDQELDPVLFAPEVDPQGAYSKLCGLLGHAPALRERIPKKIIREIFGMDAVRFREVSKAAGMPKEILPTGHGKKHVLYTPELLEHFTKALEEA